MTRSTKKSGSSTRKQPATRRARQGNVRKRTSSNALLRKTSKHPSVRPPAALEEEETPAALAPRAALRASKKELRVETGGAERGPSERPVAHSLKPESAADHRDQKASPWIYLGALLVLGGGLWVAFGNSGGKSVKPDATSGKVDMAPAAAAPVAEAAPPPPVAPPAVESDEPEKIIELDEPEAPQAAQPVVQRRVLAAKRAPKEVLPKPAPAATGPFDRDAANSALSSAAAQASACRQDGDPTGVAKVVVTFAPSGRVTSATINGPPFAGTPTGSCIAKTMRGMNLPPFQGDLMTISKTVVIM